MRNMSTKHLHAQRGSGRRVARPDGVGDLIIQRSIVKVLHAVLLGLGGRREVNHDHLQDGIGGGQPLLHDALEEGLAHHVFLVSLEGHADGGEHLLDLLLLVLHDGVEHLADGGHDPLAEGAFQLAAVAGLLPLRKFLVPVRI